METSPLTKELYSIDWASRFEQYQELEKVNFEDLNKLLSKIEEIVQSGLNNKKGLDNIEALRKRLDGAQANSSEWHHLSMLINLHVIRTAIPKGLTASATLSAIQIMGHMWNTISRDANLSTSKVTTKAEQATTQKPQSTNTASKNSARAKTSNKNSATPATKPKKAAVAKTNTSKPATKPNKRKENPVTENVVIKKLTSEAEPEDEQPLAKRCLEVASSLATEYPQYTLTAIRVMTAEKLGVTRQYVENLDIKPARFK